MSRSAPTAWEKRSAVGHMKGIRSLAMQRRHFSGSNFSMPLLRQCAPWSSYRNNQGFNPANLQSTIRSGTAGLVGGVSGNTWPLSRTALETKLDVADRVDYE